MDKAQTAPALRVNKIDAATRQLNTGIELWFEGGDAVSIHTLASASHQIIYDIVKSKDGPDLLFDSLVFKDEFRAEVNQMLRAPQNFFKHADSDAEGEIEFKPIISEAFMMMSLTGLSFLQVKPDWIRSAFAHWFALNHPELLNEKGKKLYGSMPEFAKKILTADKATYFKAYRYAVTKLINPS